MNELKTRDSENSIVNKYSYKKASTLDAFVERSAYVSTWKEIVNSPIREIHIILQFSSRLEPKDQIYSNIANELYLSDVKAQIIEQKEDSVIIKLNNTETLFKQYDYERIQDK